MEHRIQYLEQYFSKYWTADNATTTMSITAVEERDGMLHVAGEFSTQASYAEGVGNVDPGKTAAIEGRFEATVPAN